MFKWFWKILCVVMCLGATVHAQNVDELLDQLQQAPSPEIANELVSEIWPLWLYPETNSDQRPKMEQALRAMDRNNFAKADLILTDIITAAPDYTEAWNKRATIRFLAGDFVGSEADIYETLQREPRHFGAISGLGLINMHLNEYEKALNAFKHLRTLHPHSRDADEFIPILNDLLGRQDL